MSDKAKISASYIDEQKAMHGWKPLAPLDKRNVLITGDSRANSIGEAIRTALDRKNSYIVSLGGDVRDYDISHRREGFDTFIICHGVTHLDWIEDCPTDKIQEIMDVNITSIIKMVSRFVQVTLNNPQKKQIIVIGSMAHRCVLNGSAAYCASKAAVNMFCRCIAWELAPKGYDVFCIHPSNTLGAPMSEDTIQGLMRYRSLDRQEAEAYWGACLPKAQWLLPENIADLVVFLMSGKAEYLSGTPLDLPGGQR